MIIMFVDNGENKFYQSKIAINDGKTHWLRVQFKFSLAGEDISQADSPPAADVPTDHNQNEVRKLYITHLYLLDNQ
jgi:hypothetical protein